MHHLTNMFENKIVYTKGIALGTMQRKTVSLLVALLLFSAIPLNVSADENDDIPTNASSTGVHDSLVAALAHADLVATLQGDGPFTVFAPTDQAFADAGIDLSTFDNDEANATLVDILTYHVVSGSVMSSDLVDAGTADALNGDKLSFTVGTEVKVNGAVVTTPDVASSNGVIHVIDKVLMPPIDIYVSDGSMSEPYFQFYSDSAGTAAVDELDITNNYKFQRLSNPSAHPFYVGDSGYNTDSSENLIIAGDGSSSAGISDAESFTLFFRDGFTVSDTLSYFCTVHSNMVSDFTLTAPVELVDIPTVATGTGVHTSLVAAVVQAGLLETLQGDGPFTVFAPTDDAFADAGIDLSTFETDEEIAALADILTYHVVAGSVLSTDLEDKSTTTAVNGDSLAFAVSADGVMVNDANVVIADVLASNGVIHVIDKVLMPPIEIEPDIPTVAARTGVHTALVAALTQADLVTTLQGDGPFTVFAPTDDAFTAAGIDLSAFDTDEEIASLADILLYHVYSGAVNAADVTDGLTVTMVNGDDASFTVTDGTVMIGDATVTAADVTASNGVIHVIDKVLMPPAAAEGEICYNWNTHTIVPGASQADCEAYMYVVDYEMNGQSITGCYNGVTHAVSDVSQEVCESYVWTPAVDIATTASATTIHNSLVAALAQAELVATLSGADEYTVFAPTDAAFEAAGIDLAALDTPEGKAILTNILLYHVVPGTIMSSDLSVGMTTVTAANEDSLTVHVTESGVMVGTEMAMVTLADVPASNGVIHVIDKVLTPPADNDVTCDVTIGISSDGYAFSPAAVTIDVNQTVCWSWTSESMAHNVKEVDGMKSSTFVDGGITSGEPSMTVDFHHTFTEDTIFYYACEPHISVDMFGKITVGDGGVEPSSDDDEDSENNTPGFLGVTMIMATLGAVLFARSNRDEE